MLFVFTLSLKVVLLISFVESASLNGSDENGVKNITHKINTTDCTWKICGRLGRTTIIYGNVTIHQFPGDMLNNGPHVYGICTFHLWKPLDIERSSIVDIAGRHSLAIKSNCSINISSSFVLDWSLGKNRSDMWLGGFCSRDNGLSNTNGYGPGGGPCYGSAGHGGMGIDFERGADGMKYGWRYAFNNSNIALIGGSSGGVVQLGSGLSCGGGAIMISSNESVSIDATISANAYSLLTKDSHICGGSGGTIIIQAKKVHLTANASLVARGAPGGNNCQKFSGSGGVIVINGIVIGDTPSPSKHTGLDSNGVELKSYGVVIINGVSKDRLPPLLGIGTDFEGCYSTKQGFDYSILPDFMVRPLTCISECKKCGFRHAVLHVKLCACVRSLDKMTPVDDSNCSLRCFRREQMRCGGRNETNTFYVVYATNATSNKWSNISTTQSCPRKNFTSYCKFRPRATSTPTTVTITSSTSSASGYDKHTISEKLQELSHITVTGNNSVKILQELSNLTTSAVLSPSDLNSSLSIFENIVEEDAICTENKTECERVGQLVLNVADNLLNSSVSSWSVLRKEEKRSPEILLHLVEQAAATIGKNLVENDTLSLNSSNFDLRIERVFPSQFNDRTYVFSALGIEQTNIKNGEDESVFLPASLSEAIPGAGAFNLNLLKYRPHSALVNASLRNSTATWIIGSNIIAISVSPPLKKDLADKVVINFPQSKIATDDMKRSCQFLDFEKKSDISWSTRGCIVGAIEGGRVECQCNHFTSFAVLIDTEQAPVDAVHIKALSLITYLGCTISLICLVVTLTTFVVLKTMVCDHIWIHCNLVAALTLAQIVFIFGIKATENKIVCQAIALTLQYLFTAAIFWMGIEGIHLYRKVVKVFMKTSIKKCYYIFGWGGPAVMVCISALLRFDGVGNEKACWLSTEKGLIWAFVAPVLSVFVINLIILLLVIRIMLVAVNTIPSNGQNSSIRNGVKGVMFLLPILGLTWVFGVVAVNSAALVFQYIFTILNSLQGFFIFLFHCVFNKDVRAALRKRQQKKTTIQRAWSNESTWKSKEQKGSLQSSRMSNHLVKRINVKTLPDPPRSAVCLK